MSTLKKNTRNRTLHKIHSLCTQRLSYRLQSVPSLHFSPQSLDSWECVRCDQAMDQATTRHQFTRPGQRQAVARPSLLCAHWTSLRPALVPAWLSGSTAWLARNCGLTKNCFLFLSQKSAAALSCKCRLYTFHKTTQYTEFTFLN